MFRAMVAAGAALMLVGCATPNEAQPIPANKARLTVVSDPPGARVSGEGKHYGDAPFVSTWTLEPGRTFPQTTPELTAVWVSGAYATAKIRIPKGGESFNYVFKRPDVPGIEQDLQHARRLAAAQQSAQQAQQRENSQAGAAALLQILGAAAEGYSRGAASGSTVSSRSSTLTDNSTDQFCSGFVEGYRSEAGSVSIMPTCPIPPIPRIGSSYYSEGIREGARAARSRR